MNTPPEHLRLAMVTSSLGLAGAEKQTVYMAGALRDAGIDLQFFYLRTGGYYEKVLRQMGVCMRRIYTPNRPWVILAGLMRALWQFRPHVVLASQFEDLIYAAPAGRCCGALTLGGVRSDGLRELKARGPLSPWMFRMAHGLIPNSHRARQNLISRGVDPSKMEVLPNVIDLQDFDARSALPLEVPLPSQRVIAAAVGRLHECKRFDRFIEALAVARRREPALAGIVAGADCGTKAALQERAHSLGLSPDDLSFIGECDRIPALLARAALLVLTSDYEGFPNVILEAMAARRPVITTPVGDAPLIVQHGQTGYVVEGTDVAGLAGCMVRLAQSPSLRMSLGEAGRKRVEQEFGHDLLGERLVSIINAFAKRAGRSRVVEILRHGMSEQKSEPLPGRFAFQDHIA
jgi:glycosyltransferase involved in cell wall biosynthesis